MKLKSNLRNLIFTLFVFVLCACTQKTFDIYKCVEPKNSKITMKWGKLDGKTQKFIDAYILKTNGVIEKIQTATDTSGQFVARIPDSLFCPILPDYGKIVLRDETLNVQADTMTFIFYENPNLHFVKRSFWNHNFDRPELLNRDYRIFYIRLETLKDMFK